jgi:hypothetical protein
MAAVDVQTEIGIARSRSEVASYSADPDNATEWYANIATVEWRTPRPVGVGTQLAFVAHFLGREISYVYEVKVHEPGIRHVMATADGPFPMETTYEWEDAPGGGTTMRLTNRGNPSGFSRLAGPFVAMAVRRANGKDLMRLKRILERD